MSENLVPELCRTKAQIEAVADDLGLQCFFPELDELTLDIDKPFSKRYLRNDCRVLEVLAKNGVSVRSKLFTKSKSGNTHVYLWISRPLDKASRIALQAALGSDPVRETLSILRDQAMSEAPIALFETYEASLAVLAWRNANEEIRKSEKVDEFEDILG